jgi:hypothetical protein
MANDCQDVAAAAKGFPAANNMDHMHDGKYICYFHGESAIIDLVPSQTNKGRSISRMRNGPQ